MNNDLYIDADYLRRRARIRALLMAVALVFFNVSPADLWEMISDPASVDWLATITGKE